MRDSCRPRTWSRRCTRPCATASTATVRRSGLPEAREAVAAENTSRGWPVSADRVVMTSGSSEGIDFVLTALADPGDEVLVPLPTYPLYTAILPKIGAREVYYPTDPKNGWQPDPKAGSRSHHAAHEGHRHKRPEQSDRRLLCPFDPPGIAEDRRRAQHSHDRRRDLSGRGVRRPHCSNRRTRSRCARHFVVGLVEGISGARMAHGMAGGWRRRPDEGRARRHHEARRRPVVLDDADAACRRRGPHAATGRISRHSERHCANAPTSFTHAQTRSPASHPPARPLRSTQCRRSSCRREKPTPISSSALSMPLACCASMDRGSGWIRRMAISEWSHSHRRTS